MPHCWLPVLDFFGKGMGGRGAGDQRLKQQCAVLKEQLHNNFDPLVWDKENIVSVVAVETPSTLKGYNIGGPAWTPSSGKDLLMQSKQYEILDKGKKMDGWI